MGEIQTYPLQQTEEFHENELYEWVLRKLGHPTVTVELTEDQVKDAMDEALATFSRYKSRKLTEAWIAPLGISNHVFTTPGQRAVFNIQFMRPLTAGVVNNIEAQMLSASFTFRGLGNQFLDVKYYEYIRQWERIANRELGSEPDYHVSDDRKSVWLWSPGRELYTTATLGVDHVDVTTIPSAWKQWFREYTLAESKLTLSHVRGKWGGTVFGANKDIQLNSSTLAEEAKAEKEKLIENIQAGRVFTIPSWG